MEWNSKQILKLIAEYRQRPSLWNAKNPQYSDKFARERALTDMAFKLDTSIDFVRKKINNLRSQYLVEEKKVMESMTNSCYDDVYKPRWAYYKELGFLKDCTILRESGSNVKNPKKELFDNESIDPEDPDLESNLIQDTQRNHDTTRDNDTPMPQSLSKKRKFGPENELMAAATAAITNVSKKDDLDAFGAYIASELRTLTPDNQTAAKSMIFNTLIEFKLNTN